MKQNEKFKKIKLPEAIMKELKKIDQTRIFYKNFIIKEIEEMQEFCIFDIFYLPDGNNFTNDEDSTDQEFIYNEKNKNLFNVPENIMKEYMEEIEDSTESYIECMKDENGYISKLAIAKIKAFGCWAQIFNKNLIDALDEEKWVSVFDIFDLPELK